MNKNETLKNTLNKINSFRIALCILLLLIINTCQLYDDNTLVYHELVYHENGHLKSLKKIMNDTTWYILHYNTNGELNFYGNQSQLKIKNTGRLINFPFDVNNLESVLVDSITAGDTLRLKFCIGRELIPWVSQHKIHYLKIANEKDLPDKLPFDDTSAYYQYIDSTFLPIMGTQFDSSFVLKMYDNPEYFIEFINLEFEELKHFIKTANKKDPRFWKIHTYFAPLYLHEEIIEIKNPFRFRNKFNYCLTCNVKYRHMFVNWGKRVEYGYWIDQYYTVFDQNYMFDSIPMKTDGFTILEFKENCNKCITTSIKFSESGIYHIKFTSVFPFGELNIISYEDSKNPFMTIKTPELRIKVENY